MIRSSQRNRRRRDGFTLIEMTVVCFMSVLLTSMMAGAWAAFGRSAVDIDYRCRIAQEASLAAESLARDLSGYLPCSDVPAGDLSSGKFISPPSGPYTTAPLVENNILTLHFDTDSVTYSFVPPQADPPVPGRLVRSDQHGTTTVACYLTDFQVVDQGTDVDPRGSVSLQLTFSLPNRNLHRTSLPNRNLHRTYHLIGVMP